MSNLEQQLAEARARIAELEKENKGLLSLDVETLNIVRGRLDANIGGNAIVKIMAASLSDFLKDSKAENFCVIDITDRRDPDNHIPMEVTIKRASGKTPAQVIGELRARIAELEAEAEQLRTTIDQRTHDHIQQLESTLAACKDAGFIDDGGKVRRVLGTLPTTADECIVGANCTIWHPRHGASVCRSDVDSGCWAQVSDPYSPASGELYLVEECYSSAEASKQKGQP